MTTTNYLRALLLAITFANLTTVGAQRVQVNVNLDTRHVLETDSTFDRSKFVNIHAEIQEAEWDGANATSDLRNDFLNRYNVYLGRETGNITWNINNQIKQDVNRPGFADTTDIASLGNNYRANYATKTALHAYEARNKQVLCAQLHPFYPDGKLTNKGWAFSTADNSNEPFGTATGEYIGRFIKNFYGTGGASGPKLPQYVEVINEPLWHLVDFGTDTPLRIFRFHNTVAAQIRKYNPGSNLQIGGYCTAFPDLDKNNFQEWEQRWKLFMDTCGANMDYWSIHLYDFPAIGGKKRYRKGSNLEATFDMMEQYSFMKFGKAKLFEISEFGAQMHDYAGAWSAYRDWLHMKSVSSMMMQFMERSNLISKAIDFLPVKAEWGTTGVNKTYDHRLMRKENEPVSYTGNWVFTENVKLYQLWADVKGMRVKARTDNADIMTNAFIDNNKAYVVINNLEFISKDLDVNILGAAQNATSIKLRHLYLSGNAPVMEETSLAVGTTQVTIMPEATMVIEYTYANDLVTSKRMIEKKYYADAYFKPIVANTQQVFNFNQVEVGQTGDAILRLGIGRAHGKSLTPTVVFNGTTLTVPANFRGDAQTDRPNFFGVLEIPVANQLLQLSNSISVTFSDAGGFISSAAMQVFDVKTDASASTPVPFDQLFFSQNFETAKNNDVNNYFPGANATGGIDGTFNYQAFETLSTPASTISVANNSGEHTLLVNKPTTTSSADGKNRFSFTRSFAFSPAEQPQVAQFKFDFEVLNNAGLAFANQDAIAINIGEGVELENFGNGQNNKSLVRLNILVGQLEGRSTLREPVGGSQGAIDVGKRSITIVLNNSAIPLIYNDPSGSVATVAPGKYDVYIGNTITFNEVSVITPGLKIRDFRISALSPTINGGGAPSKYDIKFDNFNFSTVASAALPVSLLQFNAIRTGTSNTLTWQTAQEFNNSHFDVLRSSDGADFKKIASIKGNSSTSNVSQYSFVDEHPFEGDNFYQLKQVDKDGKSSFSNIALVKALWVQPGFEVNVGADRINIKVSTTKEAAATVSCFTIAGAKLSEHKVALQKGTNDISIGKKMAPGIYVFVLYVDGQSIARKIVL